MNSQIQGRKISNIDMTPEEALKKSSEGNTSDSYTDGNEDGDELLNDMIKGMKVKFNINKANAMIKSKASTNEFVQL